MHVHLHVTTQASDAFTLAQYTFLWISVIDAYAYISYLECADIVYS